jgi:hypothetical protein
LKIEEVKKKYKDEWVLAEILCEDELGNPTKIKVIAHSKNKDDLDKAFKKAQKKYTYQFYTGKIPKKGYAVAFMWL